MILNFTIRRVLNKQNMRHDTERSQRKVLALSQMFNLNAN